MEFEGYIRPAAAKPEPCPQCPYTAPHTEHVYLARLVDSGEGPFYGSTPAFKTAQARDDYVADVTHDWGHKPLDMGSDEGDDNHSHVLAFCGCGGYKNGHCDIEECDHQYTYVTSQAPIMDYKRETEGQPRERDDPRGPN